MAADDAAPPTDEAGQKPVFAMQITLDPATGQVGLLAPPNVLADTAITGAMLLGALKAHVLMYIMPRVQAAVQEQLDGDRKKIKVVGAHDRLPIGGLHV